MVVYKEGGSDGQRRTRSMAACLREVGGVCRPSPDLDSLQAAAYTGRSESSQTFMPIMYVISATMPLRCPKQSL